MTTTNKLMRTDRSEYLTAEYLTWTTDESKAASYETDEVAAVTRWLNECLGIRVVAC